MAPYDNSLWFVETNIHPMLEIAQQQPDMINYIRPSFWSRFMELQRVMWDTNAGLTARHAYDSRPLTWPVLRRGINYWTKDHRQVYLLGNPVIWYGSLCAIMVYLGARALLMLRAKRGSKDFNDSSIQFYDQTAGFLTLGWAMHFLPFFAMHRQLFLHHYLPALYFSILLLAVLFDALTAGLRPKFRFLAALGLISVAFLSYTTYAPITYATPWTKNACERARLLKTWDLSCHDFPDSTKAYADFGPAIHTVEFSGGANASTGSGSLTNTAVIQGMLPQAGNHPFEEAPRQAAASSVAESASAVPYAENAGNQVPPPAPAAPHSSMDAQEASASIAAALEKERQGADIKGLDQEGVEAVVLEGTGSKVNPHTRPTGSIDADAVSQAATAPSLSVGTADEVHVVADI